jgi:hypothetical protein
MQPHSALYLLVLAPWIAGCSHEHPDDHSHSHDTSTEETEHADEQGEDHEHDEVSLGTSSVGGLTIELAQGHGVVVAGGESQLVVKLPYTDKGATTVRGWLGTEDRTLSLVGLGEYAPSHDDYDVHVTAPDPLPQSMLWWFEIERPDGSKLLGSASPLLE